MDRPITILSEVVTDQSELVVKVCFETREKGWEYLIGWENKSMGRQGLLQKKIHNNNNTFFAYVGQRN